MIGQKENQLETQHLRADDHAAIPTAADLLRRGLPVVFPTDTVYGVGVLPQAEAVAQLYALKSRPAEKGIPILLADAADLERVAAGISPAGRALMARFWPGPLTLVCRRQANLPAILAPDDTIAVRVPDHPVARALIRAAGGALATSSANRSGDEPARSGAAALAALSGLVAAVLDDGPSPGGVASTVVDCTGEQPVVLRAGPLSAIALGLETLADVS